MATETPGIGASAAAGRPPAAAPAARRPGRALAVIATAQLMIVLDLTIVNPGRDLHA